MAMTSSRPYMIRALYEWIVDNGFTPVIVVNATTEGASLPQQYVNSDGQIILNVSPGAVIELDMGNKAISFNARFGGIPTDVYVPVYSIMGIYARENGQGMNFDFEAPPEEPDPEPPSTTPKMKKDASDRRASLRVVK